MKRGKNQNDGGWTSDEDAVLLRWYESHGIRKVMALTGRTWCATKERARWYGLKVDRKTSAANRTAECGQECYP